PGEPHEAVARTAVRLDERRARSQPRDQAGKRGGHPRHEKDHLEITRVREGIPDHALAKEAGVLKRMKGAEHVALTVDRKAAMLGHVRSCLPAQVGVDPMPE